MRLTILPLPDGKWEYRVENKDGRMLSYRTGKPIQTEGERLSEGAYGETSSRWWAIIKGREMFNHTARSAKHLQLKREIIKEAKIEATFGGPVPSDSMVPGTDFPDADLTLPLDLLRDDPGRFMKVLKIRAEQPPANNRGHFVVHINVPPS